MFLLYVRLFNRDDQPSSPQKKSPLSSQRNLAQKAHHRTVKHLRQVESNHTLERRLFL